MAFKRNNKYVMFGLTLLSVVVASIIIYIVFSNFDGFFSVIRKFIKIISPFLYGLLFAYLMNPIMGAVEKVMEKLLAERDMSPQRKKNLGRVFGVGVAFIVLVSVLYLIINMIVPQIVESINTLVDPKAIIGYYDKLRNWMLHLLKDDPQLETWAISKLEDIYKLAENWLQNLDIQAAVQSVTSGVYSVVKEILNILIGFIAAIYMLLSKDKFCAQLKKMTVAFFSEERCNRIFDVCRRTNKIFSGFIVGKLIDSLIIAILCYFGMLILNLPYPMLISTIIGITNIIPFFGPIFGLVPSALLILLINPWQCLYFVIFILCLQQFDGNILGPHILGDSVGLSSFWILVSITVAGGIFGFAGMVLGVPFFAVIYSLISDLVNWRLSKKGKSTQTQRYVKIKSVSDLDNSIEEPEKHIVPDFTDAEEVFDMNDDVEIEEDMNSNAPDWEQTDILDDYEFEGLD